MKAIIPIIIFIVSVIITIILLFIQIKTGLRSTGLNEPSVWGVYIASFTFSLGCGAGMLVTIFYLSLINKLNNKLLLKLSFIALISLALAGIFITLDLGRPERFYLFLTSPNFHSPLVWDFWVMNTLIFISIILIITGIKNKKLSKILSIIFMVITFLAYFVTTDAFSGLKARLNWYTPILNINFILSALIGGLSLYLLFSNKNDEFMKTFFFKITLSIFLILEAISFFMGYYSTSKFIIVYLLIGNIIPIIFLFLSLKENLLLARVTALLILISIWFKRSDIISSGYISRWLPFANTTYIPTNSERLLVFNIFIMGLLGLFIIFMLINKRNPQQ